MPAARAMAVIAGAGSGKSETMAARLVLAVANGMAARTGARLPSPGRPRRARRPGRSRLERCALALTGTGRRGPAGPRKATRRRRSGDGTYHAMPAGWSRQSLREGPSRHAADHPACLAARAGIVGLRRPMDEITWTPQRR